MEPWLHPLRKVPVDRALRVFFMRSKIAAVLLCALSLLLLSGCADSVRWNGYENEELSKYVIAADYKGLRYTPADESTDAEQAEAEIKNELWNSVIKASSFYHLPEPELAHYRDEMREYYEDAAEYYQVELSELLSEYGYTEESFESALDEYARYRVQSNLLLYSLVKEENITIGDAEYNNRLAGYVEAGGYDSPEALEAECSKDELVRMMYKDILLDMIYANAKPEATPTSGS